MKHLTDTIRKLFHGLDTDNGLTEGGDVRALEIYEALSELERLAGEPVAWTSQIEIDWAKRNPGRAGSFYAVKEGPSSLPLYAVAPPAKQPQYEAGDMASAAAQGFRDGVASVTGGQQPVAWAMPKGDGTFIDVITPAEHARDEGSYTVPLFAHPLAQQPHQCALCGSDEAFTGACGGGKNNPRALCYEPVAQQPQAEPDIHEAQGQIEFLDKKNNALSAAIRKVMARLADLLDEDQFKEIEEIVSFAGVQPQAEAVPLTHVLVPVEPTLEMGWAYLDAANAQDPLRHHVFNHDGYRAMLAAAQGEKP